MADRTPIPPVPKNVKPYVDDGGDQVYDRRLERWRVRDGKLACYIKYRVDPKGRHVAINWRVPARG